MDCFCGCGDKLPGKVTEVNLEAANVALELLAWDKTRSANPISADVAALIDRGADCYGQILATLHGEPGPDPLPSSEAWLDDSFQARRENPEMTTKGSLLHRPKLNLTEPDYARLDRKHPERSFSGRPPEPAEQLKGLADLHAAGALTDEEFTAAKARLTDRLKTG